MEAKVTSEEPKDFKKVAKAVKDMDSSSTSQVTNRKRGGTTTATLKSLGLKQAEAKEADEVKELEPLEVSEEGWGISSCLALMSLLAAIFLFYMGFELGLWGNGYYD